MRTQFDRVLDAFRPKPPMAADHLEAAREDTFAFTGPKSIWRQIRADNPKERLNRETRRRTGSLAPR